MNFIHDIKGDKISNKNKELDWLSLATSEMSSPHPKFSGSSNATWTLLP